ncbi:STAS domain-containing protein [Nitriliruptoraceae bacterium ZYF776]|nr:STAS domain-containing protein [Profundirhabdus halotolerans]
MRTELTDHRGWTVVTVVGAVDVATAPQLRSTLQEVQFGGAPRLVIDLDAVEFLDSFGLGVLVGAVKRARSQDADLALRVTRDRLRHLLEVTRVDTIVRTVAELDELPDA